MNCIGAKIAFGLHDFAGRVSEHAMLFRCQKFDVFLESKRLEDEFIISYLDGFPTGEKLLISVEVHLWLRHAVHGCLYKFVF